MMPPVLQALGCLDVGRHLRVLVYLKKSVTMKEDPNDDHFGKGESGQGRLSTSTLQLAYAYATHGLGPASLTQKLARGRLRPARFKAVNEDGNRNERQGWRCLTD